ncbi:MAG: hypothetical protein ACPG77_10575, partial [Nannocystaceae bacterium]
MTWRVDGTGVAFEQISGGLELTRLANAKTVFGTPIADVLTGYGDTSPEVAIAFRVKPTLLSGNSTHFTGGLWRDDAGVPKEMLHAGPYMQGTSNFSSTCRRERTTGAYNTEFLAGATAA